MRVLNRLFVAAVCLLLSLSSLKSEAATSSWGLNDVSILFPIHESVAVSMLPSPETKGSRGELLPLRIFEHLPRLLPEAPSTTFSRFRVVAARIDPCFPGAGTPEDQCQRQLRFVWQPLEYRTDGNRNRAHDATLHTFHSLSRSEFESLLADLVLAREGEGTLAASLPLQVHPILAKQGLQGHYYRKLMQVLLTHSGEGNLTRITFMTNAFANNVWDFGGFDIHGNDVREVIIPRISAPLQRFVNSPFFRRTYFTGNINPAPQGEDTVNLIASNSRRIRPIEDEAQIIADTMAAVRIENPKVFHPENIDCVSCHVAQPARVFTTRQFPWLALDLRARDHAYTSRHLDAGNTSPHPELTTNLRAFGYFETVLESTPLTYPAISQRVINESCEVVEYLNQQR